jgi:aminoglycoside phosphotransferase (APT) family kinase protein
LITKAEVALVSQLPRQLVHGDFWDNNVLFRHGRPVLLADFDFVGEQARVDDLALTLWCARCDLSTQAGPAEELARLRRLDQVDQQPVQPVDGLGAHAHQILAAVGQQVQHHRLVLDADLAQLWSAAGGDRHRDRVVRVALAAMAGR